MSTKQQAVEGGYFRSSPAIRALTLASAFAFDVELPTTLPSAWRMIFTGRLPLPVLRIEYGI